MFITIDDFTGFNNISVNSFNETDINKIIEDTETSVLKDLLGDDLYNEFINDLEGAVPKTEKFTNLLNGVTYENTNEFGNTVNVIYQGLKPMLILFIYSEIINFINKIPTASGIITPKLANAEQLNNEALKTSICDNYNKAVELYGFDIEEYLSYSESNYSANFRKRKKYWKTKLTGNCFNFLYFYQTDFPNWQFVNKNILLLNGSL